MRLMPDHRNMIPTYAKQCSGLWRIGFPILGYGQTYEHDCHLLPEKGHPEHLWSAEHKTSGHYYTIGSFVPTSAHMVRQVC